MDMVEQAIESAVEICDRDGASAEAAIRLATTNAYQAGWIDAMQAAAGLLTGDSDVDLDADLSDDDGVVAHGGTTRGGE